MNIKRRYMTLLEIMIVISLITLIGGVIGYNMKGSLERGKIFKTEQAKKQLEDILLLEYAKGEKTLEEIIENPIEVLKESGLVKNPEELMKDGWNEKFKIDIDKGELKINSKKYNSVKKKKNKY
ncbi:MAG: hypothetical protein AMS24_02085 [Chlamydiae bacterium SM23_39]|nr:MAG: hypothetical protein AMS24_02085 [Chlamydiae bacterium SM23_39]